MRGSLLNKSVSARSEFWTMNDKTDIIKSVLYFFQKNR